MSPVENALISTFQLVVIFEWYLGFPGSGYLFSESMSFINYIRLYINLGCNDLSRSVSCVLSNVFNLSIEH